MAEQNQSEARAFAVLSDLRGLPAETAWVEFKESNADPIMIGTRISALANSARLNDKNCGYLVWGIQDGTHKIVGTQFNPTTAKQNGQPLEFWLAQRLNPHSRH